MFWTQALISFAVWVAYSLALWRRLQSRPVAPKGLARGPALLIAGVVVLAVGGFAANSVGGLTMDGMTSPGWLIVTAAGIGFVHCQSLGVAAMLSGMANEVTSVQRSASSKKDTEAHP